MGEASIVAIVVALISAVASISAALITVLGKAESTKKPRVLPKRRSAFAWGTIILLYLQGTAFVLSGFYFLIWRKDLTYALVAWMFGAEFLALAYIVSRGGPNLPYSG